MKDNHNDDQDEPESHENPKTLDVLWFNFHSPHPRKHKLHQHPHKHAIIVHTSANFIQIHTYTIRINACTILILTCTINNTCTIHVINTCPINSNEFFITSPLSSDCNGRRKLERIYMRKTTSPPSHAWMVFHRNPCKFRNFQAVLKYFLISITGLKSPFNP